MLPMKPRAKSSAYHYYKAQRQPPSLRRLEVATGKVTTQTRARHTGADFLAFCARSNAYPEGELAVVLDNVSPQDAAIREWLDGISSASTSPESASWMNHIETWFGILSRQAIREAASVVKELIAMIMPSRRSGTRLNAFAGSRQPTRSWPKQSASDKRLANRDTKEPI